MTEVQAMQASAIGAAFSVRASVENAETFDWFGAFLRALSLPVASRNGWALAAAAYAHARAVAL